jgi:FkbM family methyltransferase
LIVVGLKGAHIGEFLKLSVPWLKTAEIRTVIDVGAHTGEFASAVRAILPDASIYAFEPLPDCHVKLSKRFETDSSFQALNVAIGERRDQIEFHRCEFSKCSSILRMDRSHQELFPWTADSRAIRVEMRPLDDYISLMRLTPKVLLKVDVQGYEDRVLRGGARLLGRVDYVLIEVSYRPLYEGQALFGRIHDQLTELGFHYRGSLDQLLSPLDGSVLQADALFARGTSA